LRCAPQLRRHPFGLLFVAPLAHPEGGSNFLPEPAVPGLVLPATGTEKLVRQADGVNAVLKGVQSHPSLAVGSGRTRGFLGVGAVGGKQGCGPNR
jgi:hypothetical protein